MTIFEERMGEGERVRVGERERSLRDRERVRDRACGWEGERDRERESLRARGLLEGERDRERRGEALRRRGAGGEDMSPSRLLFADGDLANCHGHMEGDGDGPSVQKVVL